MPIKVASPVENTQLATPTPEPKKEEAPYVRGVDQGKKSDDDDRDNDNNEEEAFTDIEICNDSYGKLDQKHENLLSELQFLIDDNDEFRAKARDLEQQNAALRSQLQVLMGR